MTGKSLLAGNLFEQKVTVAIGIVTRDEGADTKHYLRGQSSDITRANMSRICIIVTRLLVFSH